MKVPESWYKFIKVHKCYDTNSWKYLNVYFWNIIKKCKYP